MQKIVTPKDLKAVGNKIWGDWWQTAMGRYLGYGDRTVRMWAKGDRVIPRVVEVALNFALNDPELKKDK